MSKLSPTPVAKPKDNRWGAGFIFESILLDFRCEIWYKHSSGQTPAVCVRKLRFEKTDNPNSGKSGLVGSKMPTR